MSKKVVRKFSVFALILVVMLASLCIFTLYQSSVNAVLLDALDKVDIDTTQISSSLDRVDVAEAAGTVSFSDSGTQDFPTGAWNASHGTSGDGITEYWSGYNIEFDGITYTRDVLSVKCKKVLKTASWNFSGSFTVNLSGKILNYARGGLVQCRISAQNYWDGNGQTQTIYFSINGGTRKFASSNSQNEDSYKDPNAGRYYSDYINIGTLGSNDTSFTVNLAATAKAYRVNMQSVIHGFQIELSYIADTTGNKNTNNYTTNSSSSGYFQVSDNQSALKSVTCTHTTFNLTEPKSTTLSYDIAKERIASQTYSLKSFFNNSFFENCYNNESDYFGFYTISATDNQGNTSTFDTTIYYYSATINLAAGRNGSISDISTISGKTYGDSYSISAKVTANPGYYFKRKMDFIFARGK